MKTQTWKTRTLLAGAVFVALIASPAAGADYPSTVLSQIPVGYWRLNETLQPQNVAGAVNSGSLGASALGTYNSFPARGLTGPFAGSAAVGLDGGAQTVTTPWVAGLNTTNFSVEMWVNPSQVPKFAYIASSVHIGSPRSGWYLAQDDGSTFAVGSAFVLRMFYLNGTAFSGFIYAPVATANVWYHLVVTYDGTTAAMYTNGVLAMSQSTTNYVPNLDSQFSVGSRSDNAFFWPGKAAEVAMYTSALSAARVSAHYTAGTTTPGSYAATVQTDSPVLYHRYQEPIDPPAANVGTLGSAASGLYIYDAKAGVAGPATPTFPGLEAANKATAFDAGGGVVRIPPLNLNTNTVTMSCWINATNAQAIGAGLVIHGSGANASGLTIDQINGGLGLGYIWNGANYGISPTADFGLPPLPDSGWAYAALVITPSEGALYICDGTNFGNWASITNTFNVSHLAQPFASATLVGAAGGFANRNFNGAIDEVTIFNRALSAGELYTQYSSGIGGVPPKIFADLKGPAQVFVGDPLVLKVDAGGTPALGYVWHRGGTQVAVTTNGVLTIASASLGDSGTYDVTISNAFAPPAQSISVPVTVSTATAPNVTQLIGFTSRTLYPTGTLSMAVVAGGGGLKYQWYKNSAAIGGATNSAYGVQNVTTNNAGSYSVSITNTLGSYSNATPVVITIPAPGAGSYEAAIVVANPESWWRLDETGGTNLFDGMGRHDGYYTSLNGSTPPVTFGAAGALVSNPDTAVTFTPSKQGVGVVPYSPALNPNVYTVEFWAKTTVLAGGLVPASTSYSGGVGWRWSADSGNWIPNAADLPGNGYTTCPIISGYWSHLVITYDKNRSGTGANPYQYFINGQGSVIANYIWSGPGLNVNGPLIIGGNGVSAATLAERFFDGQVDEVAIYPRLLSATEITNHFVARGIVIVAPSFSPPLLSQTVTTGKAVSFSTTVLGTSPILQWYKGASPILNATNATYSIASTAITDGGSYTLWATNSAGTNSVSATLTVVPPAGYANVTNGVVLHLRFDGATTDSSGRGNNGTASSTTAPAFVPGIIGSQALQFTTVVSGANVSSASYVSLGTVGSGPPADLQFGSNTSFSVSVWVKLPTNSTPGDLPFIGSATNSQGNPGWFLSPAYQTGGWQFGLNDGVTSSGNNIAVSGPANSINDGAWHNFVLTVDRTAAVANSYLDGVLVASRSIASLGSIDNNNYWPIVIGQDPTHLYPEAGSATLDDVAIWRRALTSLEVANIASAGSTGGRSFDTVGPIPLAISRSGGSIILTYGAGTLLEATNVGGPYVTVSGASAPSFTTTPSGAAKFYRVLVQ